MGSPEKDSGSVGTGGWYLLGEGGGEEEVMLEGAAAPVVAGSPFCPQCGVENKPGARFCRGCGRPLGAAAPPAAPLSCPQCGTPIAAGRRFCHVCGNALAAAAQAPAASTTSDLWVEGAEPPPAPRAPAPPLAPNQDSVELWLESPGAAPPEPPPIYPPPIYPPSAAGPPAPEAWPPPIYPPPPAPGPPVLEVWPPEPPVYPPPPAAAPPEPPPLQPGEETGPTIPSWKEGSAEGPGPRGASQEPLHDDFGGPGGLTPPPPPPPEPEMRSTLVQASRVGDGAVAPADTAAMLVIVQTPQAVRRGQVISLREAKTVLGRGRRAGCLLDDPQVDDFHAVVNYERRPDGAAFYLYPVSAKGVALNGRFASEVVRLHSGDRIRVGSTELVFFQAALKGETS